MCEPIQCSARWKTWCSSPINSTVCVGRLLCYYVGYCNVGCDKYPSHYRRSSKAVSFDQWKRCDPLGILYNFERKLCIVVVTAIVMTLRSLIKTEPRTAKLRQVDSDYEYQGLTSKWTSEWMNQSLVVCSLPLCHFLILSFQVVCFWEKILQHDFACCLSMLPLKFQGTWMVPSSYPFLPKQTSEKTQTEFQCFVHLDEKTLWISVPINAKKNLLQHHFFAKHTYLLELHLELNSGSSFHLYRSLSPFYTRCAPFRAWKCSQARPAALQYYGSPLSAVSSTCKEIIGTNAMEVCALPCSLQAWQRHV